MTTDEAARRSATIQREQGEIVEKLLITIERLTEELKISTEKISNLEKRKTQ